MRDAVVIDAVRTPIGVGKPSRGQFSGLHPVDLGGQVVSSLLSRNQIEARAVEDVIWGCVSQVGEQSFNIGRSTALAAGLPESTPGVTVDRQCGSSLQALAFAAAGVLAGHADVVIAGGVEVMSRVPMFSNINDADPYGRVRTRYEDRLVPQGISAELLAERYQLSRRYLDELSATSHERAAAAQRSGEFDDEIVPVLTDTGEVTTDQGIRPDTNVGTLGNLRPVFREDGVVTAGNASQISDGAAALLVTTSAKAAELGVRPIARIHSVTTVGVDPILMLHGPIVATAKILDRAGLSLDDIGAFEINEAFASVLGAWYAATGASPARTNQLGGAIALGHPLGASGARIAATLLHRMRRTGTKYGLEAICEGGGMANAMVFERL
ncbi:thiolase family protein [Amycolatopsis jejuensis]|uniref:thiolase family protein n=1 Tax=Amycolatopsis jejuensis TaxID=330084 RepID=UPI00052776FF|nr:thiolase family protein [Amycolatopsis jejuensis]